METIRTWVAALRSRWSGAPLRTRVMIIAGVAVVVALALFGLAQREPRYEVLFANLSSEDAAQIVERLRDLHVDYRLGDEGSSILVPESALHETRLTLAAEALPSGGGVGFELFDRQRFGESEFAEQVQFRRALEGELARTIRHIDGVESARVHLVLPQRSLFVSQQTPASASVALRLRPGFRLRDEQVRGIVHLVAGSVRDLEPANVTIVDGAGRPLAGTGDEEDRAGVGAEELRERIESARERAVQELLDTTLGPGRAVVEVSADVSFSREERLEESYDPERVATRSFQVVTEGASSAETGTQGVPGAVSALPGGAPAEPLRTGGGAAGTRSELRNFEITKVVRRAVEPLGRITRLQVAVVVDGRWEGEGEGRHFVPATDEELARIRSIAASAAGVIAERGDQVTVECVPFAARPEIGDEAADDAAAAAETPGWAIGAGLAVLVALAVVLAVASLRRRRRAAKAQAAAALPGSEPIPALTATRTAALGEGDPQDPDELRRLTVEVARAEPQVAARVIRAWLVEGTSGT